MGTKQQLEKPWFKVQGLLDEIAEAKGWNDLSSQAKKLVLGIISYIVVEKAFTWHHVYHTPEKRLRGNRKAWFAVTGLVDVLGPVAFFLFGRKGKNKR